MKRYGHRINATRIRRTLFNGLIVMAALVSCPVHGEGASIREGIQTGKGHRFAATDYSGQKVFIVSADGEVEWEYSTGHCNDLWVLPNGNLLFNTGNGVREVTREKEIVFDYHSESEVYACQRLSNGNTLG